MDSVDDNVLLKGDSAEMQINGKIITEVESMQLHMSWCGQL